MTSRLLWGGLILLAATHPLGGAIHPLGSNSRNLGSPHSTDLLSESHEAPAPQAPSSWSVQDPPEIICGLSWRSAPDSPPAGDSFALLVTAWSCGQASSAAHHSARAPGVQFWSRQGSVRDLLRDEPLRPVRLVALDFRALFLLRLPPYLAVDDVRHTLQYRAKTVVPCLTFPLAAPAPLPPARRQAGAVHATE